MFTRYSYVDSCITVCESSDGMEAWNKPAMSLRHRNITLRIRVTSRAPVFPSRIVHSVFATSSPQYLIHRYTHYSSTTADMSEQNALHDTEMISGPQTVGEDTQTQPASPEPEAPTPSEANNSNKPKRKPREPTAFERDLGKSFFPVSRVQRILKADKVRPPRVLV